LRPLPQQCRQFQAGEKFWALAKKARSGCRIAPCVTARAAQLGGLSSAPLEPWRVRELARLPKGYALSPGLSDSRLLAAARVMVARAALDDWTAPLAADAEADARRVVAGACVALLASFPTTLAEDEALLAGGERAHRVAIAFRAHKKSVLAQTLVACRHAVERSTSDQS
jgi:hypothetical protein